MDEFTDDNEVALRLNAVLTYFIRMIAVHQHAQLSKNMNVADRYQKRLTMKNEFLFGSYVTTLMSKHYFATQLMVEGILNKEVQMEIKGVHLRSSKIAHDIKEFAHKLMREVLDAIHDKRLLDAAEILHKAGELERKIIADLNEGSWVWLTKDTVKDGEVFKNPESSIYQYHLLWKAVFEPKYGKPPDPPYSAVKINTYLDTKQKTNDFINELEDKELGERLRVYLEKNEKTGVGTFYVPYDILAGIKRIPKEMIAGADIRSIIKQNLKSVYAVLEACGLYIVNEKITRLISDEH